MNSRPWCLALLLASASPLPAQQDPAALLALSHARDSKLGFTTPDLSEWTVVADSGALGIPVKQKQAHSPAATGGALRGSSTARPQN